ARLARGLRTRFSAVSPDSPTVGASVLSDKCDSSLGCERPERAEVGLEQERGCGGPGGRGVSGARRPVPVSERWHRAGAAASAPERAGSGSGGGNGAQSAFSIIWPSWALPTAPIWVAWTWPSLN